MSMKISSRVGGPLPTQQASTAQPKEPTSAPAPANVARARNTDSFEPVSKPQEQWAAKFAEVIATVAPKLESLVPAEFQVVKDMANTINEQRNVVAGKQKERWATSTPVLQQTEDVNCGAATAAMLVRAKAGDAARSDAQLMDELGSKFASQEGTTPQQLARMLAHEGIEVKRSSSTLDKGALEGALHNGGKAVAMVDSNRISPGGTTKPTGNAHWVLIDGMDEKGSYLVKDPSRATSYFVKADELDKAMSSGRETHQGGGMLLVENTTSQMPEPVLAEEGAKKAEALGKKPGIGSNTQGFGRESS
jgi:predicted double-glycine peptidase